METMNGIPWSVPVDERAPVLDERPAPAAEPVIVRPRTVLNLVLTDPKFGGLEIKCRSQSFLDWTDDDSESLLWPGDNAGIRAKNAFYRNNAEHFVSHIIEWNLTDEQGHQVPVSVTELMKLDRAIVTDLFIAWGDAAQGRVTGPLEQPSSAGRTSVEASMPRETLSANPSS